MATACSRRRLRTQRTVTIQETANLYGIAQGTARSTPTIRLRGQWLAQAGFSAGARVTVAVAYGHLVITGDPLVAPAATKD